MTADAKPNPLVAGQKPGKQSKPHPMLPHAQVWQAVSQMPAHELQKATDVSEALAPMFGALAHKKTVARTDVIKAAADAAGKGIIAPSQAVEFISTMPDDPNALKPWLMEHYITQLTGLVHAKAAQMPAQGAEPQPSQAPDPNGAPQQ